MLSVSAGQETITAQIIKAGNNVDCRTSAQVSCTINVAQHIMTVDCPQSLEPVTYDATAHATLTSDGATVITVKNDEGNVMNRNDYSLSYSYTWDGVTHTNDPTIPSVTNAGTVIVTVTATHNQGSYHLFHDFGYPKCTDRL